MNENRIVDKLDKIETTLVAQEINLAKLTVSVEEHVKRSNHLEDALRPIQKHVSMVQGAVKLVAFIGVLAAILDVLMRFV